MIEESFLINNIYNKYVSIFFAGIGAITGHFIGGWDTMAEFLILSMVVDFISGVAVGYSIKKINSKIFYKGVLKKFSILLVIAIATMLDYTVGNSTLLFRNATCAFYIANDCLSFLENLGKLGVPLPKKLTDALIQVKEKEKFEEKKESEGK